VLLDRSQEPWPGSAPPTPSSAISTVTEPLTCLTRICAVLAQAYFATFVILEHAASAGPEARMVIDDQHGPRHAPIVANAVRSAQ
jgi:hypothetical protein